MFTIGKTRPNCDANQPQEDAQGTRQIRRGRFNNETPEQRERRLQIQREQRRRRRHRETTEGRQHRLGSAKTASSGGNRGAEELQIEISQAVVQRR